MSHPSGPPPYAGPPRPARRRRRPRGWWFLLPALLLLVGAGTAVWGFVTTLGPLADEDAVVAVDGRSQVVGLDDDGARLLMAREDSPAPDCTVTDPASGDELPLDGPSASVTYSDPGGDWAGFAVVEPRTDGIELACEAQGAGDPGDVRVVPDVGAGGILGGLVTVFAGIGAAGLGFLLLVVLVALYATGAPRRTTRDGDASTARSASGSAG